MLLFQSAILIRIMPQDGLPWANVCCPFRAWDIYNDYKFVQINRLKALYMESLWHPPQVNISPINAGCKPNIRLR